MQPKPIERVCDISNRPLCHPPLSSLCPVWSFVSTRLSLCLCGHLAAQPTTSPASLAARPSTKQDRSNISSTLASWIVSQRRLNLFQLITPPVALKASGRAHTGAHARRSHAAGGEKTLQCLKIVPLAAPRLEPV